MKMVIAVKVESSRICSAGFSLFELLAVLVILAIGAALVAPATGNWLDKISFRQDRLAVKKQLRGLKELAVSRGQAVRLQFAEGEMRVQLGAGEAEPKPFPVDPECEVTMEPELVLFSPLGTATPAAFAMSRGERRHMIRLDALTGQPLDDMGGQEMGE
ncbi:MAG: prepilin-type N-terminal cleavage/methylation domain-containing protein [Thermodesulfobacteriota bacterium]